MKHKHILITDDQVHPALKVYRVWFGSQQREQRQLSRVLMCAASCADIYFKQYSKDVCTFLERLSLQLYPELSLHDAAEKFEVLNVIDITPSMAVSLSEAYSANTQFTHVKNLMSKRHDY